MMKFVFALLLVILAAAKSVQGRSLPRLMYVAKGRCPTVNVITEFKKEQYLGLWYEIARYPVIYELGARCVTAEYSQSRIYRKQIKVKNSATRRNGKRTTVEGRARIPDENEPGKLDVSFRQTDIATDLLSRVPGVPEFPELPQLADESDTNYWILDTDYGNYSLVHSCNQRIGFHIMSNWILSRTPHPDREAIVQPALDVFESYGIPTDAFLFTDQDDCVYDVPDDEEEGSGDAGPMFDIPVNIPTFNFPTFNFNG